MSTSIRNHLPGTIEQIVSDKVLSEIVINTAAGPVTSIITTGSVKRMNLKKGDAVFAIIKATEVSGKRIIIAFLRDVADGITVLIAPNCPQNDNREDNDK